MRAYGDTASLALEQMVSARLRLEEVAELRLSYDLIGIVEHTLTRFDGSLLSAEYGVDVGMSISLPKGALEPFRSLLGEATGGKITILPVKNL